MTRPRGRFPAWLRKRIPPESETRRVRNLLDALDLHTVCQSAHCPNLFECFGRGTATFMILGNRCTRDCRFCAIEHGEPEALDPDEPRRVAKAAAELGLEHVVVTSVTRDDLPDGGSGHFAATIEAIRAVSQASIEVLVPDFQGVAEDIKRVLDARPDVLNHNVETVPRLYARVRPQASYERSLGVLRGAAGADGILTKSGLMVGLGETSAEASEVLRDLRRAGCEMVTIGQYLRPSEAHLPVERFVTPDEFRAYKAEAERLGFLAVASGPFVRSSYEAGTLVCAHLSTKEVLREL